MKSSALCCYINLKRKFNFLINNKCSDKLGSVTYHPIGYYDRSTITDLSTNQLTDRQEGSYYAPRRNRTSQSVIGMEEWRSYLKRSFYTF